MCGIFGVINFNGKPIEKEKVIEARDVLKHRGPDDEGIYFASYHPEYVEGSSNQPDLALAFRRLSIIDLSPAGHQPMTTEDGRYTIVFNGEIYNYMELRENIVLRSKELGVSSAYLKSSSDTEIILKLFALEGKECIKKLRGMFAFVIWDNVEKKLFAVRDRFGIKPYYFLHNKNEFIFSSELKAIKHYKGNLTTSMKGIDAFLRTGSIPAPLTIYEECTSLLPGHYLEIDSNGNLKTEKYWSFLDLLNFQPHHVIPASPPGAKSGIRRENNDRFRTSRNDRKRKYDEEAKRSIRASLLDTISAHMVSDVEVGAFLSGGIDSTAIVSLMRQAGHEKIKTISVTFPGNKLDESKYSNLVAKKYNTDHFEYRLEEKELIDDFEKIIDSMDQPTIDGVNTYFVSKAAASFGLKVVLSGLGGDELFGGYSSFKMIPKYRRMKNIPLAKTLMRASAGLLKNKLPAKAVEYLKYPYRVNSEYKLFRGLFTSAELKNLGWSSLVKTTEDEKAAEDKVEAHSFIHLFSQSVSMDVLLNECMSPLQYISYLESTFYMANQLLRDSDVFSMAHSLELRVPFVDHLLYSSVLPYLDTRLDKKIPKKMLVEGTGDLPDEIVSRPKMGFTFPFGEWIKNGKLGEMVNDSLNNKLFNHSVIQSYIHSFHSGKVHWSRVWAISIVNNFI